MASGPGPSSPRASTSAAVFPSYGDAVKDSDDHDEEDEDRETLMDAIWAIDNGLEQQVDRDAASKARSQLGLLVKDLEVGSDRQPAYMRGASYAEPSHRCTETRPRVSARPTSSSKSWTHLSCS